MENNSTKNKILHYLKKLRVTNKYLLLTLFCISFVFIILEIKHPYYFFQDDSRQSMFPAWIHAYDSLMQEHEIAQYNFHQLLGIPSISSIFGMELYPISYLSVFLSKIIFGHFYCAVDIFIYIHFIIGTIGFYKFIYSIYKNSKSAFFGAIAWTLATFSVHVCCSWGIAAGVIAYFPWMMYLSYKFVRKGYRSSFVFLVIFRCLFFYSGHTQFFVYAAIFEVLITALTLVMFRKNKLKTIFKKFFTYTLSWIATLIMILPLFLPVFNQLSVNATRGEKLDWEQFILGGYTFSNFIEGLLSPFNDYFYKEYWMHQHKLSYVGYLTVFFLIFCLAILFSKKLRLSNSIGNFSSPKRLYIKILIGLGLLSFMWSMNILIHYLIYMIPVINRMRGPFKLQVFTGFFIITIACYGFSILYNCIVLKIKNKAKRRIVCNLILLVHLLTFVSYYLYTPYVSFGYLKDKPPFSEPLVKIIPQERIISTGYEFFSPYKNKDVLMGYTQGSVYYMAQNFASLWGLYHFSGYFNPFITKKHVQATLGTSRQGFPPYVIKKDEMLLKYFRQWSIRWYIVSKDYLINSDINWKLKYEDNLRKVYYDKEAMPMFFWRDGSHKGIVSKINTNYIELDVERDIKDKLTLSFLKNDYFTCTINGNITNISENRAFQMLINVPKGKNKIIIRYSDPNFKLGSTITISFIILVFILFAVTKQKKIKQMMA